MSNRGFRLPFNSEHEAEVSSGMKTEISEMFQFFTPLTQVSPIKSGNAPFTDGKQDERLANDYLSGRKWMYSLIPFSRNVPNVAMLRKADIQKSRTT